MPMAKHLHGHDRVGLGLHLCNSVNGLDFGQELFFGRKATTAPGSKFVTSREGDNNLTWCSSNRKKPQLSKLDGLLAPSFQHYSLGILTHLKIEIPSTDYPVYFLESIQSLDLG